MDISQVGINLIKSFEGCVLHAYKAVPSEKYYTIGYGHYGEDVQPSMSITNKQAEDLLKKDLQRFVTGVNDLLKVKVNQYQFDSLVSFSYNCGVGALRASDLLSYTNKKQFDKAANEFGRWIHSNGKVLQGLVNRREAERTLFLKDVEVKKPKEKIITYTIKSGDNLTNIAKAYHTSIGKIMKLNPKIDNANVIYAKQKIKVPDNR